MQVGEKASMQGKRELENALILHCVLNSTYLNILSFFGALKPKK